MDTDRECPAPEELEFGNSRPSDLHRPQGKVCKAGKGQQEGLGAVLRAENSPGPRGRRLKGRAKGKKN